MLYCGCGCDGRCCYDRVKCIVGNIIVHMNNNDLVFNLIFSDLNTVILL